LITIYKNVICNEDAEKLGYWVKNTCGSSYFFSYKVASFNPIENNETSFNERFKFRELGSRIFKNAVAWE
jgi:hypothetical protein